MSLEPLEFIDCLSDGPIFRQKLDKHEKELERTSEAIKTLIADGNVVLNASQQLGKAQRQFSQSLIGFKFGCIGQQKTDDETLIAASLGEFGNMMMRIEDERERMLVNAHQSLITYLENFRKIHIGQAQESKKVFDKQTQTFCAFLEKYLNLNADVPYNQLDEADAQLEMEKRGHNEHSMKYVLQLQEVQERKNFEFVEMFLGFMQRLHAFHHVAYETCEDSKDYIKELQYTLQTARNNFETTNEQSEKLMLKMLDVARTFDQADILNERYTRQGYLFLKEKKVSKTSWTKYWCVYNKKNKHFDMMPYSQSTGALTSSGETVTLHSSIQRASYSENRRFCMELTFVEKPGTILTFQALSDKDRKTWMELMDGKEKSYPMTQVPQYAQLLQQEQNNGNDDQSIVNSSDGIGDVISIEANSPALTVPTLDHCEAEKASKRSFEPYMIIPNASLDDVGCTFMKKCISAVEANGGLDEQGLYSAAGVNSKVNKLIQTGLDRRKAEKLDLNDSMQYDIKAITNAIKRYLRTLPEPLMTFKLHPEFINAAKRESLNLRLLDIHALVHKLPPPNFTMLELLIAHLKRVADNATTNLMTIANLGVCFGPTLMRSEEETVAAIMDIKFSNIIIEILIEHYDMMFKQNPEDPELRKNINKAAEQNRSIKRMKCPPPPPPVQQIGKSPNVTNTAMNAELKSPHRYVNVPSMLPDTPYQQPQQQQNHAKAKLYPNSTYGCYDQLTDNIISGGSESLTSFTQSNPYSQLDCPRRPSSAKMFESNSTNSTIMELSKSITQFTVDAPALSTSMQGMPVSQRVSGNMTGSVPGNLGNNINNATPNMRTVRTLYRCKAENASELSFEPNVVINNVKNSKEPGWLEGCLDGKTGLIPENYVEFID